MPGLIDAHWHAYLCCNTMMGLLTEDVSFSHLTAGQEAGATLLRGFTTIRDAEAPFSDSNGPSTPASCRARESIPAAP